MIRWIQWGLLLACALNADAPRAEAFQRRSPYPPRYVRGSYAEYISRKKTGLPYVRQVYSGYQNGFPPPAFLYYGYPHSGDDTGIGPLERQ